MFHIRICLGSWNYWGLDALDMRRRMKLKDASHFCTSPSDVKVVVTEGFARAFFPKTNVTGFEAEINLRLLAAGDLVDDKEGSIILNPLMDGLRAQELWLAARYNVPVATNNLPEASTETQLTAYEEKA